MMKMNVLPFALALVIVIAFNGCATTDTNTPGSNAPYVPKANKIRMRLSAATARGQVNLSRFVYVFPPLKVNQNKEVMDRLIPMESEDGTIYWISSVRGAADIRSAIEDSLRSQGYKPVTFSALTKASKDHSVMVLNPYYSGSMAAEDNSEGRVAYTRITIATYPVSLQPEGRLELINQEAISVYHESNRHLDALRTAFDYSIRNIGINREWMIDLPLLESGQ
jgi:hypothetical protein